MRLNKMIDHMGSRPVKSESFVFLFDLTIQFIESQNVAASSFLIDCKNWQRPDS